MLDGVGDVAPLPIEARRLQRLVENATGWADERRTGEILVVARLFADQHDARASCAFAEHGLRRVRVQIAAAASGRSLAQRSQTSACWQKIVRAMRTPSASDPSGPPTSSPCLTPCPPHRHRTTSL